jgi:hypothetical protein
MRRICFTCEKIQASNALGLPRGSVSRATKDILGDDESVNKRQGRARARSLVAKQVGTSSMLGDFVLCGGMRRSMFDFYNARGRPADVNMGAGRHAWYFTAKSDEGNTGPS